MNNREFKKHLQAVAHGEKAEEEKQPAPKAASPERARSPQKERAAKKPPIRSKLGQLRVRRRAM
jgi:hypothetical protein